MFQRFGNFIARYWVLVLLAWVAAAGSVYFFAPEWDNVTRDGDFAYLPAEMTSIRGEKLLEAAFPEVRAKSTVVLVVERPGGQLQPADWQIADRLVEEFTPQEPAEEQVAAAEQAAVAEQPAETPAAEQPIVGILSHRTEVVGQKLISPVTEAGQGVLIVLQLRNEFMAIGNMKILDGIQAKLREIRAAPDFPQGLQLGVSGSAAIGADMRVATLESISSTEAATVILVITILLLIYRSPGLVVVPLAAISVSVLVATGIVATLASLSEAGGYDYKIFKDTRIFIVVLLFGAGVDFCLFLIARYREELEHGLEPGEAIARALGQVGDALVGSAFTTIVGLGLMYFAAFGKFRNSGPTIALCLVVALLASLTLAPALLRAVGPLVFWPFGIKARKPGDDDDAAAPSTPFRGLWERLSRLILAHPGLILVGSLLLLAPMVYRGAKVELTYDLLSELPTDRASVVGTRMLRRHFAPGETSPVTILAYREAGGLVPGGENWKRMDELVDELAQLEYRDSQGNLVRPITSVRSSVEPLGKQQRKTGLFGAFKKEIIRSSKQSKSTYLAQAPEYVGKVTRIDLVFKYDPFSIESIRLLDHVQSRLDGMAKDPASLWHGSYFYYLGTTAGIRDLRAVTSSDWLLIEQLVPIGVLGVLIVILRRPWISLYLICSVLIGYFFTMGATELVFSYLYGATYHGLDWKVPVFLFVILIAVGQDYNIYLATRVFEEQDRRGKEEGLRVALVRTGGIITSCGIIMAGTFVSMATGTLRAMVELGFALSFGVLLDTFVIRTILVPSFLVIYDRFWDKRKAGKSRAPARMPLPEFSGRGRAREETELVGGGYGGRPKQ